MKSKLNKWNASGSLACITQFNIAAVLTLMVKVHWPQMTFDLDHVTRKLMQDDQGYLAPLMSKYHELGSYTS